MATLKELGRRKRSKVYLRYVLLAFQGYNRIQVDLTHAFLPISAMALRRKLVLAVDDSDDDERAVKWAVENLMRPDGAITLNKSELGRVEWSEWRLQ
jgi:hypothetical protein